MRNVIKNFTVILALAAMFGANIHAGVVADDTFQIGRPGSSANKKFIFNTNDGSSNKNFTINSSTKELTWNSNLFSIGDGTNSDKTLTFKKASNSPAIKYNNTTGFLEFTQDGTTYKKFGSGSGGGSGTSVLANNPDFETSISANWTDSAAVVTAETTSPLYDTRSAKMTATTTGQTYTSDAYSMPVGLQGTSCLGSFYYKTTESTNRYKIQVLDGSNNVLSENFIDASATSTPAYAAFTCPSSGTIKLRLASTGTAAAITIDNAFLGNDSRLFGGSQSSIVASGYYPRTASCSWATTSSTPAAFATVAACPGPTVETNYGPGVLQTTDTDLPQATVTNLPAGSYKVTWTTATAVSPSNTDGATLAISDGTTVAGRVSVSGITTGYIPATVMAVFNYTTSGTRTFSLFGSTPLNTLNINPSSTNSQTTFLIERFAGSAETGMRADQLGWRVDATLGGADINLGTATVSSFTEMTDAGLTLVNSGGAGASSAKVACSSTNAPSGTTCSAGSESAGINFDIPVAGDYEVCADFTHNYYSTNSLETNFVLNETPANAQTVTVQGKHMETSYLGVSGPVNTANTLHLCSSFNWSGAGNKTVRLMYRQPSAASVSTSQIFGATTAPKTTQGIRFTVQPRSYSSGAAPVFKGMVTSNSSGRERIERAYIPSGCTTIGSQSGAWLTAASSPATGRCTLTIAAGIFSGTPSCMCSVKKSTGAGMGNTDCDFGTATSSTNIEMSTWASDTFGFSNAPVDIMCMGPN